MRRSPMKPGTSILKRTGIRTGAIARKLSAPVLKPARKVKAKASQKGKATAAERAHMGRVAAMGCCLCQFLGHGQQAAEVHHVRARHGWGRSGHMNTIPLCPHHHLGQPGGVHDMGREQFAAHYGISETELLARVIDALDIKSGAAPAVTSATPITKT